jgi:serine phosphatase RsbU (regulator of sigma subunit)
MGDEPPRLDPLLAASHRMVPDDLPRLVRDHATGFGARDAVVYLADLDQRRLVPLSDGAEAVHIDGTLAGRCFGTLTAVEATVDDGATIVWIPVVDGTERVGVLQLTFGRDRPPLDVLEPFASLVAELVVAKNAYGDYFLQARRREPLTVGAELLAQLLPPLTFATDDVVIAAGLAPAARLGGDAFDYGINGAIAHVAIFDALGHDLDAGLLATAAVAAFRNARRSHADLAESAVRIGETIATHFEPHQFVTGIVARLDASTGRLTWCAAGHPPALLLRDGRMVKELHRRVGQPFGVGPASAECAEQLEPGDQVIFYTDGITEARDPHGLPFGVDRLADLIAQRSHDHPPPEVIRRVLHRVEEHSAGPLRDDATVVLVEWRGAGRFEV